MRRLEHKLVPEFWPLRRCAGQHAHRLKVLAAAPNDPRGHALSRLPDLLEELEHNCTANGIRVHWAETTDIVALTALARKVMREHFQSMTAGLSGVNFAVAETGTLCLVENEGNGRMCTTLPNSTARSQSE